MINLSQKISVTNKDINKLTFALHNLESQIFKQIGSLQEILNLLDIKLEDLKDPDLLETFQTVLEEFLDLEDNIDKNYESITKICIDYIIDYLNANIINHSIREIAEDIHYIFEENFKIYKKSPKLMNLLTETAKIFIEIKPKSSYAKHLLQNESTNIIDTLFNLQSIDEIEKDLTIFFEKHPKLKSFWLNGPGLIILKNATNKSNLPLNLDDIGNMFNNICYKFSSEKPMKNFSTQYLDNSLAVLFEFLRNKWEYIQALLCMSIDEYYENSDENSYESSDESSDESSGESSDESNESDFNSKVIKPINPFSNLTFRIFLNKPIKSNLIITNNIATKIKKYANDYKKINK